MSEQPQKCVQEMAPVVVQICDAMGRNQPADPERKFSTLMTMFANCGPLPSYERDAERAQLIKQVRAAQQQANTDQPAPC